MKKTLIASAVAAVTFASGAAMAAPTVYGNIQTAYKHVDTDKGNGNDSTENKVFDNGTTLGVKHSHEVAPGVTGFAKLELNLSAVSGVSGTDWNVDEGYMGVKGDFGSVQVGSDDTVDEWIKIVPDEAIEPSYDNVAGLSESSNLQYISPKLAGMATVGVTLPLDASLNDEKYAGALGVKAAPVENLNVVFTYAMGRDNAGIDTDGDGKFDTTRDIGSAFGLAATYTMDNITVAGQFQKKSADADSAGKDLKDTDLTSFALRGTVGLGANSLSLAYRTTSTDADTAGQKDTVSGFWLQGVHNISDNMYAYVEYVAETTEYKGSNPDMDENKFAVGALYAF